MIASSAMDGDSYNSTLDLDQFSNFLSHLDEISYSSDSDSFNSLPFNLTGIALISLSSFVLMRGIFSNPSTCSVLLGCGSIFGIMLGTTLTIVPIVAEVVAERLADLRYPLR